MIKFLRGVLVISLFTIFGIGSLFVGLFVFPVINLFLKGKRKKFAYSSVIHYSWMIFLKLLIISGALKIKIDDIEKIKNISQSIIVSTHPSYIDVLIILAIIPKTTCFVAPKIAKNYFFKNIAKSMFLISGNPIETVVQNAKNALDDGFNVLIFPMGTRHRKNEFPKIRKGASQIAIESKNDITALKLTTDIDFLQIHQPIYDAGDKRVIYELSYIKTIKTEEITKQIDDEVELRKKLTYEIKSALYE